MSESPTTTDFILELDARPDLLRVVRAALTAWCERTGIETARADQICLAVDEASTNIIRHAYDVECGRIRLNCSRQTGSSGRSLLITLEDDGKQVPLETIRPRELDNVKPGGLGVHLIQQVMDEAVWCHRPDGGTTLTMRVDIDQTHTGVQQETITHA
ncbi:MAG: ATP-binding protein [Phycisphaerales bacterium]|jgi:anti-sigma regulatory factor (Ser/Thr protein kinase)|nr:ATP-binding protein [Phycisphaerales bacterium]